MRTLVLLTVLCWSTLVSSQNQTQSKNIFILAGQSNMAGRGGADGLESNDTLPPPECSPNPRILRFNAGRKWEEAHDPLHKDIDVGKADFDGVGPGMPFANTLLSKDPSIGVIGLVPCAVGDTSLKQWSRGEELYNNMIQRTKAALADGGVLRALLWYQGEADADTMEHAESYKTRYEKFVADVRADLQAPALPVVQVAISNLPESDDHSDERLQALRESQLTANIPHLKTVDAWGLPHTPEKIHLTAQSQVQVGKMMAEAYLQISP